MRKLGLLSICLSCVAFNVRAEPFLEQPILRTIKQHFVDRLSSETCTQFFRYYSMDTRNWVWRDNTVKASVTFDVEYISTKALYGTAGRTVECLGRRVGEGYFERGKTYRAAGFVYTLSKWDLGWHVDKVELEP